MKPLKEKFTKKGIPIIRFFSNFWNTVYSF
jgi:hypothetical protein